MKAGLRLSLFAERNRDTIRGIIVGIFFPPGNFESKKKGDYFSFEFSPADRSRTDGNLGTNEIYNSRHFPTGGKIPEWEITNFNNHFYDLPTIVLTNEDNNLE